MIVVVFDTNVILDAILERSDYQSAQELVMAAAEERITGIVTANSLTDIYYIAKRTLDEEAVRRALANVLSIFRIAAVDEEVCGVALEMQMKDYEDAVVAACAIREDADCIITSDKGFLRENVPVLVQTPKQLLDSLD